MNGNDIRKIKELYPVLWGRLIAKGICATGPAAATNKIHLK